MTNALTFRTYYELAKPRMVYANVIVAAAAFVYASHGAADLLLGATTVAGLGFVIASACTFNNYMDREMDAKMERTKCRALPLGLLPGRHALVMGAALLATGVALLYMTTPAALIVALAGWVTYVLLYTPLKPRSPHALFVGAVAGAVPPVVGYAAVAGVLDATALALFLFLFFWQLPHFVAISIYRGEEYAAADVPMYFKGPHTARQKKVARTVFLGSLVVLLAWCALLVAFA
ncbi:MAG: protoheme IX farnesyltransferase [Candidatus Pacebacteria bacterium]|nr:protoheme IX farnesyltransferase [Candidatus Paceibacterota bacterium]